MNIVIQFLSELKGEKAGFFRCLALLSLVIFGVSTVFLIPMSAYAAEYQVVDYDVHFRAAPGMDTEIIGSIPYSFTFIPEDIVTDEEGNRWYQLSFDGKLGYVAADYTEEVLADPEQDIPDSSEESTLTEPDSAVAEDSLEPEILYTAENLSELFPEETEDAEELIS